MQKRIFFHCNRAIEPEYRHNPESFRLGRQIKIFNAFALLALAR